MRYPPAIQNLIDHFRKLPTVGPKTAERYVFYLINQSPELLQQFAQAMAEVKEKISVCQTCMAITETNPCEICSDPKRNRSVICLVADTRGMLAVETTKQYQGVYHILGGVINMIDGIKPEQLNVNSLLSHLNKNSAEEVILAFNPDLEGETTSIYMAKLLKPRGIKITRLAKGLPMGADLEYADEITLSNALKYRSQM